MYIKARYETVHKDGDKQRKEAERRANLEIKEQLNRQLWGDLFKNVWNKCGQNQDKLKNL